MTFFSDLSKTFRAGVLLGVALALAVSLFAVPSASADYEQAEYEGAFEHFGVGGEAEQLVESRAIAINATGAGGVEPGSFYVVGLNGRVVRFAPGGEGEEPQFKEAWGWKTIESGPDLPAAEYSDTVTATSGTYALTLIGTARGEGTTTSGSNIVTGVSTSFGAFHAGDTVITGGGAFPSGTKVIVVGAGTLELDAAATKTGSRFIGASETTAPIQATAAAGKVQGALVALAGVGAGALSVSGGPGDAEGTNPYEIVYEGPYTGVRKPPTLSAADVSLAGGVPSSAVEESAPSTPTRRAMNAAGPSPAMSARRRKGSRPGAKRSATLTVPVELQSTRRTATSTCSIRGQMESVDTTLLKSSRQRAPQSGKGLEITAATRQRRRNRSKKGPGSCTKCSTAKPRSRSTKRAPSTSTTRTTSTACSPTNRRG